MTRPAPRWLKRFCRLVFPVLCPALLWFGLAVFVLLWFAIWAAGGLLRGPWYLLRIADKDEANKVWEKWGAAAAEGPMWRVAYIMQTKDW